MKLISIIWKNRSINLASGLAESAAAFSASRCPLYAPAQTPREAILAAGQDILSQSGKLRGEVYPAEEIGRRVVKLYFDIILLLDRLLVVINIGTDSTAARFHAWHVLVRLDGTTDRWIRIVTAKEREHRWSLEFAELYWVKHTISALRKLAFAQRTGITIRSLCRAQ